MAAYQRRFLEGRTPAEALRLGGTGRFTANPQGGGGTFYDPAVLEKDFKELKLLNPLIDSVVKEVDAKGKAAESTLGTGSGGQTTKGSTAGSSPTSQGEELLQAITMTDIMCEPLGGPLKDFKSLGVTELFNALLQLTSRTDTEDPRLIRTVTVGQTVQPATAEDRLTRLPPDIGQSDDPHHVKRYILQQHVFMPTGQAPAVTLAAKCRGIHGRQDIQTKNIRKEEINSKCNLKKAFWTAYVERDGQSIRRRESWDLVVNLLHDEAQTFLFTLYEGDWVYVNLTRSEETEPGYETTGEGVQYLKKRIDQLTKEHWRLQASLQEQIQELKEQQKKLVEDHLGKHQFVGALSGVADCFIENYDKDEGNASRPNFFDCVRKLRDRNQFMKELQTYYKSRGEEVEFGGLTDITPFAGLPYGVQGNKILSLEEETKEPSEMKRLREDMERKRQRASELNQIFGEKKAALESKQSELDFAQDQDEKDRVEAELKSRRQEYDEARIAYNRAEEQASAAAKAFADATTPSGGGAETSTETNPVPPD